MPYRRGRLGKAIGFLFIPFFNVYWIFQAWGGFPRDYNSYVERQRLAVPYVSPGIFTAYPILILLTAIPFLGILIALVNMFLFVAIISRTCDAVNALVGPPVGLNDNRRVLRIS